jgi:Zn-dependent protease
MQWSWKIGRVSGIDIYVHATFLVVFLLFPAVFAGGSLSPLLNVLLIFSMFGCVLLHELGHALMARRFGIRTRDITLYPIGGVARLERMPRAPGAELLIALAGPAVNVAIVAALLPVVALGGFDLASASTLRLFVADVLIVNLGLVLFNMIPAFPMDGGRVLRALLSVWLGRVQATTVAARVGRTLAVCFGVTALLVTKNPIHIALAAFIYLAARAEEAQVLREDQPHPEGQGIWTAPPGYRWVSRGDGLWQLAPIRVEMREPTAAAGPWR